MKTFLNNSNTKRTETNLPNQFFEDALAIVSLNLASGII